MPNDNCLAGMACPKCGSEEPFSIVCTSTFKFYDDGSDLNQDSIEWDSNSYCQCYTCDHEATVADFRIESQPKTEKGQENA